MNGYDIGKLIIIVGFGIIVLGCIVMLLGKFTSLDQGRTRQFLFSNC